MNKEEKMAFLNKIQSEDTFFFNYLIGWMCANHLDDMIEAAKAYQVLGGKEEDKANA